MKKRDLLGEGKSEMRYCNFGETSDIICYKSLQGVKEGRYRTVITTFKWNTFEHINLEFAGRNYWNKDLKKVIERLLMLRGIGYKIPQSVIDSLLEEEKIRNIIT